MYIYGTNIIIKIIETWYYQYRKQNGNIILQLKNCNIFICNYLCIEMDMENLELCLVQTKKIGETTKTTRSQREFIQVVVWGYERDEDDD